jgi:hypothetical protein
MDSFSFSIISFGLVTTSMSKKYYIRHVSMPYRSRILQGHPEHNARN